MKELTAPAVRRADTAFYLILTVICLLYVGLLFLLIGADVAYMVLGDDLPDRNPMLDALAKPEIRRSILHVSKNQPRWSPRTVNYYYWYYGTYAMFQFAGPKWKTWNKAMLSALLPHQRNGGCEDGSWDGVGEWCAPGGRVYATAINVLTLEIYYRFDRGSTHGASAKK